MLYQVHLTWVGFELTPLVVIGTDCIHYYIFYNVIITNKWIRLWIRKKIWILAFLILLTKVYTVLFSICLSYPCLYGSWVYILCNGCLLSLLFVSLIPYSINQGFVTRSNGFSSLSGVLVFMWSMKYWWKCHYRIIIQSSVFFYFTGKGENSWLRTVYK
jgi:hypothetical protein